MSRELRAPSRDPTWCLLCAWTENAMNNNTSVAIRKQISSRTNYIGRKQSIAREIIDGVTKSVVDKDDDIDFQSVITERDGRRHRGRKDYGLLQHDNWKHLRNVPSNSDLVTFNSNCVAISDRLRITSWMLRDLAFKGRALTFPGRGICFESSTRVC